MAEPTLSDVLAALGYTHERDSATDGDGRRVVSRDGRVVGRFRAEECWDYLASAMAAAPDMYEALRAIMDASGPLTDEQLQRCHDAMTKAEVRHD